jgi:hypothetical protein
VRDKDTQALLAILSIFSGDAKSKPLVKDRRVSWSIKHRDRAVIGPDRMRARLNDLERRIANLRLGIESGNVPLRVRQVTRILNDAPNARHTDSARERLFPFLAAECPMLDDVVELALHPSAAGHGCQQESEDPRLAAPASKPIHHDRALPCENALKHADNARPGGKVFAMAAF